MAVLNVKCDIVNSKGTKIELLADAANARLPQLQADIEDATQLQKRIKSELWTLDCNFHSCLLSAENWQSDQDAANFVEQQLRWVDKVDNLEKEESFRVAVVSVPIGSEAEEDVTFWLRKMDHINNSSSKVSEEHRTTFTRIIQPEFLKRLKIYAATSIMSSLKMAKYKAEFENTTRIFERSDRNFWEQEEVWEKIEDLEDEMDQAKCGLQKLGAKLNHPILQLIVLCKIV